MQRTTHQRHRMADDAVDLVLETVRLIDAADLVALDATTDLATFTPTDALDHILVLHGKARRLLGAAVLVS